MKQPQKHLSSVANSPMCVQSISLFTESWVLESVARSRWIHLERYVNLSSLDLIPEKMERNANAVTQNLAEYLRAKHVDMPQKFLAKEALM